MNDFSKYIANRSIVMAYRTKYSDSYAIPTIDVYSGFSFSAEVDEDSPSTSDEEYENDAGETQAMRGGAEDHRRPRTDIVGVITPIWTRGANHTPYELYCFSSHVRDKLRRIDPILSFVLQQKKSGKLMKYFIELRSGGIFRPITSELAPVIERIVTKARERITHFLVFNPLRDIYYKGICLPINWMRGIIPYIRLPDKVGPTYVTYEYEGSRVYAKTAPDSNYSDVYNLLNRMIVDELLDIYLRGGIVLSSATDSDFISTWELMKYRESIYVPRWKNYIAAPRPSEFLKERYIGNEWMRIDVDSDDDSRHAVAVALAGYEIKFCDRHVMIRVTSVKQVSAVTRLVVTTRPGFGVTTNYLDVHKGIIRSTLD